MECKSAYIRPKSFVMPELIDTLWNVNNSCHCLHSGEGCELIDTLWNVNYIGGDFYKEINKELIDTLWNVNE